jgi:hypothetical protein
MSDADLLGIEGIDYRHRQFGEFKTGGDMGRTFACLCGDLLDAVFRLVQIEKSAKALCLFEGMHIPPLQVFDQLRFECLGVGEIDDANRNGRNLGDLCGAKTSRPSDDLE